MASKKHDTKGAAEHLGVLPSTLRYWRGKSADAGGEHGPRYAKLGRRVVYVEADLDQWLTARLKEAG